ncbi:MAG TPA: DUF4124 domain-containing protein [Nevskiaceae bacterium]|nr:DUF4124 domain-containing protein [Nevskiaceae bacterium]
MKPAVFLTALLLWTSSFAASYIYRWADDEGHVHYTQTPPRDRSFETLRADTAIVTDDTIRAGDEASDDEATSEDETEGDEDAPAPPPKPVAKPGPDAIDANRAFLKKTEEANKAAAEAKAKQDKERAAHAARCTQARERLAFLDVNTAHRLASVDAQGEVSRYTDEQFEKQRSEAQKAIAESCR